MQVRALEAALEKLAGRNDAFRASLAPAVDPERLAERDELRARLRLGGGAPAPAPWDHTLARAPLPPLKLPVWAFDGDGAWTLAARLR